MGIEVDLQYDYKYIRVGSRFSPLYVSYSDDSHGGGSNYLFFNVYKGAKQKQLTLIVGYLFRKLKTVMTNLIN